MDAAQAGGFAVREQSTQFQGSSFAGNAAGGALSSMFWNPAAVGQFNGINTESSYSVIFPNSDIHALPGSSLLGVPGISADSGNIGLDAVVPASYASMQLSPNLVLGLSLNAPFGLTTKPDNRFWAGYSQGTTSKIQTYNLQAALGYRVAPGLIIGAGIQAELIKGTLRKAVPFPAPPFSAASPDATVDADDIAYGFTAGVLWNPNRGTTVGLGFRSSINHDLDGNFDIAGVPLLAGVTANLKTPETVTLSLRQALTPQLTGLASVEWANWSRLQSLDVFCTTNTPPFCAPGALRDSIALGWHDSWFFSGGLEYALSPVATLRTGVAYEKSPIQNPEERTVRTPDSDRIWASIGASWKFSPNASLDFAYSHIFVKDASINRPEFRLLLWSPMSTRASTSSRSASSTSGAAATSL